MDSRALQWIWFGAILGPCLTARILKLPKLSVGGLEINLGKHYWWMLHVLLYSCLCFKLHFLHCVTGCEGNLWHWTYDRVQGLAMTYQLGHEGTADTIWGSGPHSWSGKGLGQNKKECAENPGLPIFSLKTQQLILMALIRPLLNHSQILANLHKS